MTISFPKAFRGWSFSGIYALLLVAILLYPRFPAQKFKTFCTQVISQHLSGYECSMQLAMTGALGPLPSLVQMSGQAQPLWQQSQKNHATLPFHLQGTIGKPVFRFDS